jgi:hypothetical protein
LVVDPGQPASVEGLLDAVTRRRRASLPARHPAGLAVLGGRGRRKSLPIFTVDRPNTT